MERRSVFISYRRQVSEHLARLISKDLTEHHFDTFVDLENLDGGEFPQKILSQIEAREHFIVLLQPDSLDRIGEDDNWLRREIAHALARDRNVVPVTAYGFEFRRDLVLPPDVARLASFNAVAIQPGYFDAAMKRLRRRFLKIPPSPTGPPLVGTRVATPARRLPAPQLTSKQASVDPARLSWTEVPGASAYVLEQALPAFVKGITDRSAPQFREVYRGPNRSYNVRFTDPDKPAWGSSSYRVRADAFGQAGKWSNTLYLILGPI